MTQRLYNLEKKGKMAKKFNTKNRGQNLKILNENILHVIKNLAENHFENGAKMFIFTIFVKILSS